MGEFDVFLRLPVAVTYQSGALKNEVGISKPRFFVQFKIMALQVKVDYGRERFATFY